MKKKTTRGRGSSRVAWESLEKWARLEIQEWIQELMVAEVTEHLGRERSERRKPVDTTAGYRNGYGKPRKLTMSIGTVTVRRPRVRDVEEGFESRVLPLFKRRTETVSELIPELYLHGLAHGDFDLALRGLLGDKAPLSASTVSRLKEKWQGEYEEWLTRPLDELEVVYLWVDGVYVKAGLEKEKAAVLVAVAGLSDGRKIVLTLEAGHRESEASWSSLLRKLKKRGLRCPRLVVGDGHLGIWAAIRNVFPDAKEQRCWNHRILNVLDRIPKKYQLQAKPLLTAIPYAENLKECEKSKSSFQEWCGRKNLPEAVRVLDEDWERMVTFFSFPKPHWQHLRTSNVVESPFAALRLRTDAAKRFKKVETATAAIFKLLLVAEKHFRRLNAPELMREVYLGVRFEDGQRAIESKKVAAA
ncbi:MAG: IS256 family transposase [Vicinamibacteria bacterium]